MNAIVDAVRDFVQTTAQTYQSAVQPRIDALGEAVGQMVEDAVVSGVQSLASDPLGYAVDAYLLPATVGATVLAPAFEVGAAVHQAGGPGVVALNLALHGRNEAVRIQHELQQNPSGFVDWLLGPDGPKVSDITAQVPGLQSAIGNAMDIAMGNRWIAGPVGQAFGFEYDARNDIYTTNETSIQSYGGFHDIYDQAGKGLGMDLDESVMTFTVGDVEYRLELWKGDYGAGGAFGGEIALYTNGAGDRGALGDQLEQIDGYYSAANGDNQIGMSQTIYNTETGEVYFTSTGSETQFWNLAIRTDPAINHENLGQRGELTLPADMAAGEQSALADAIVEQLESKDGIEDVQVRTNADGSTSISYDWSGEGDR
ncbi:DUF4474 domain-containing protein [Luteimonas sp. SMYT11W]|uniref:DUF4474 domain-containing protein n=1 Tax=Luteimonas flava TaxID=3115822 RepID=A0ABU7WBX5_9GAMM